MVLIDVRGAYLQEVHRNEKLSLFYNVLANRILDISATTIQTEIAQLYFKVCLAISTCNKQLFTEAYNVFSRREPSAESPQPYINDDLLVFLLITGIEKYNMEKIWINKVIAARSRSRSTITFENLINGNYYSTTNAPELIICFLSLTDKADFPQGYLNNAYLSIANNSELLNSKNDFTKISSIIAIDVIITLKDIGDSGEYSALKKLKIRVEKRLKICAVIIYNFFLFIILVGIIKILPSFPSVKKFIDDHGNLFTLLAFLGFVGVNFIPILKKWFVESVLIIMGYPKELLKKTGK